MVSRNGVVKGDTQEAQGNPALRGKQVEGGQVFDGPLHPRDELGFEKSLRAVCRSERQGSQRGVHRPDARAADMLGRLLHPAFPHRAERGRCLLTHRAGRVVERHGNGLDRVVVAARGQRLQHRTAH